MKPFAFAVLTLLIAPFAQGVGSSSFEEDWETGADGWTNEGIGAVVCADGDCAMRLVGGADDSRHMYVHAPAVVEAPLGFTFSFDFMGTDPYGLNDLDVDITYDTGQINVEMTRDAATGNNGIRMISSAGPVPGVVSDVLPPIVERRLPPTPQDSEGPAVGGWAAGEWLTVVVRLDFTTDLATAEIRDANGELWDVLPPIPLESGATRAEHVWLAVGAWYGPGFGSTFYVDDVSVVPLV